MKETENLKGIPGLLRPFKKYIEDENLPENSQIIFYGCPGTCLPFVELIAYALRDLPVKTVFIPYLEEKHAVSLKIAENLGAQANLPVEKINPKIIVVMGGLSMPNVPVTAEEAKRTISKYNAKIVGICFMNMLKREGWTDKINFDMIIDATVDPVKVCR